MLHTMYRTAVLGFIEIHLMLWLPVMEQFAWKDKYNVFVVLISEHGIMVRQVSMQISGSHAKHSGDICFA